MANQQTVAVIGCGVIGLSWVKALLSKAYSVRVYDANPQVSHTLDTLKKQFPGTALSFHSSAEEAVCGAVFVQESAPEVLDFKRALYASFAPAVGDDCLVASSSSTLLASELQKNSPLADRILIGHPFNPPHILPLVEVVGGQATSEQTLQRAMAFYQSLGKQPVLLRTERPGHLANRLQAAVWREAVDAVATGQASVEDVDLAVTAALGPRWAVMGPFTTFHLGGGDEGLSHFLDHLGGAFEGLWDDAQRPQLSEPLKQQLIEAVAQATAGQSVSELAVDRDNKLRDILRI